MKGLLVMSHRMEDGEALATRALLRRAGLDVVTITYENTLEIETYYKLKIKADYFATDVHLNDYEFVVVPGGGYVSKVVDQDMNIKELVKHFDKQGKLVAAICAGPRFLGQAGLLNGKSFTAFHGSEKDMPMGRYLPNEKVVKDHNIITARSAGAIYEFSYEIVKYLLGKEKADDLLKNIIY